MVSAVATDDAKAAMVALRARRPVRPIRKSVCPCLMAESFFICSTVMLAFSPAVALLERMDCGKAHQLVHLGEGEHRRLAPCADAGALQIAVDKLQRAGRG